MDREKRILEIVEHLKKQDDKTKQIFEQLKKFISLFYGELEKIIIPVTEKGGDLQQSNIKTTTLPDGLKAFSFEWDRRRIIISPISFSAFPVSDIKTEGITLSKELVGRIVIFHQMVSNPFEGTPVEEIYILPNGKWSASGILGPIFENYINEDNIANFSLCFLENLTFNIEFYHVHRENSEFDPQKLSFKNPIGIKPH